MILLLFFIYTAHSKAKDNKAKAMDVKAKALTPLVKISPDGLAV